MSPQPSVVFVGRESEQDGLLAAFISRLPDREAKSLTSDKRSEKRKRMAVQAWILYVSMSVLTLRGGRGLSEGRRSSLAAANDRSGG